jgi:capsular exopolysaccharide synthesis family protein
MLQREDESLRHKQEIFTAVRTRLEQKEMERNVPGSIEVLARALTPSEPFRDRRIMLTILSLVGSLGAGVGVAFLRGTFSQSIQEACDLTDTVSVPFLGQIPMVPSRLSPEDSPLVNESMRMVRTALTARMNSQKGCIVLVTSAGPGAGKSTVAAMLSKSFALSGKKVLLVDADMRNPTVSRRMGIEAAPGFVSVLTHELDDEQAILGTSTDRLWVLPTGSGRGGFDYELIANGTFKACVDRWRTKYDLIILDTPPILPVADTRILSRQVDGTIMVFREGNCRRGDVLDALASLASSGGKLMGTIFIGPCRRGTYGSAYYSHP